MTVATTVLGLLPIMFASGSGMDITKPIATPTFGGMISSTIYVLFLIPCLFAIGEDSAGAAGVVRAQGRTGGAGSGRGARLVLRRHAECLVIILSADG